MTLDPVNNALDRLYLELLPTKPSGCPVTTLGPTAQWARLEAERALWAIAAIDDEEAGAA